MNKRPHHKGIWILIAAAAIAAVTFVASLVWGGSSGIASGFLGIITTPVRGGLNLMAGWVEGRYDYAFRYAELEQENEELKQRIAQLEEDARLGADATEENERLRDLLELDQKRSDFVFESAHITARGATNWASTLTLSKGSKHGVAAGNCVVDQYGNLGLYSPCHTGNGSCPCHGRCQGGSRCRGRYHCRSLCGGSAKLCLCSDFPL